MPKSTSPRRPRKAAKGSSDRPPKPYPEYPLYPHPSGNWAKKVRVKGSTKPTFYYFGRWGRKVNGKMEILPNDGEWQAAIELYKLQIDDLRMGRKPREKGSEGLTVGQLRERFLTVKSRALDAGEIGGPTYREYRRTADRVLAAFGENRLVDDLAADDFEELRAACAELFGPVRLCNEITRVKSLFKYAFDSGLIDRPVRYGSEFKKPSASVLRRHKAKNGEKMLEAAEIRRMLDALAGKKVKTGRTDEETGKPEKVTLPANPALRAMLLLGCNCGFNNKDCADLPLSALDLDGGWIDFARTKTGIPRRSSLWKETGEALREAIAARPVPKQEGAEGLVFLTRRGRAWIVRGQANPVSVAARDVMKAIGIHRDGIGFATLRHVFRTIADACRDQVAVNHVMGHSDPSMAAHYRERIDDSRLVAVAEHVRAWLFSPDKTQ